MCDRASYALLSVKRIEREMMKQNNCAHGNTCAQPIQNTKKGDLKQQQLKSSNLKFEGDNCRKRSVKYGMDKPKVTYHFHNPNKTDEYLKVFLDALLEANMHNIEEEVRIALEESERQKNDTQAKNITNKGE